MSNPVTLSLPNGRKNKVYWVNKDGDVWFCNGWKEFAEYSKLDVSHFLVFGYEGNSLFNVIIFGKSGLEIEYPLSNDATNEEVEEIVEGSEFSAKLSEEGSKRPKEEVEEKEQQQSNKHSRKRACSDYSKHMNNGQKGVSHLPSSSRKSPVTTQARTPKPQDDLFICVKSGFPTIPFEYAKKYGEESGRRVTFRVGERSWKVKFLLYGQHSFARFSSGWFDFVRDCDLKLGDVCILRMLDQENLVFNVSCLKPNNSSGPNKT
ncbi:B3 domain-containing transcription factor VRN1-like [Vigna unguiculata]|uniref:B3 domain-containing transcription factor VRN1-like n=1 Tax=Vigna unguiculata TaxID=3917 RepID=UPI00101682A0|nr:B3 domain-containing transcription factor VRN1-like [Vigna unguiculata]